MEQPFLPVPWDHAPGRPLVGRAPELATLRGLLAGVLAGRGGLALLGGEEGIGKTTLATAIAGEARDRGALVLAGHCYDLTTPPPYGLWADLIQRYQDQPDLPPLPDPLAQPGGAAALASREALFALAQEFIATLARRRPLLLVLEDLHWADADSLDLLRHLARRLAALPLLAVATHRPPGAARYPTLGQLLPALAREGAATRLDLKGMTAAAVADLVAVAYALPPADAGRLAAYLHARAEGSPLFVAELLRMTEAEGQLQETAAGWRLGGLPLRGVPPRLRELLNARLARLDAGDQRRLAQAAAIGQEVPLDLWAAVAEVGEEALLDTVERGTAAGLLAAGRDGGRVRFAHALLRDACYEGALPARRRAWHRRIGAALAADPHPDPDDVTHHFRQAGDPRAAEWLVRAGDRAYRTFAYQPALERYDEALAMLGDDERATSERGWLHYRLGRAAQYLDPARSHAELGVAARIAAAAGDRAQAAVARLHRAQRRILAVEIEPALTEYDAAAEALVALPPDAQAALAAHTSVTNLADVRDCLAPLVGYRAILGQFAVAQELAGRGGFTSAEPGSVQTRDDATRAQAWFGLAHVQAALGRPDEGQRELVRTRNTLLSARAYLDYSVVALFELNHVLLPYQADQVAARQLLATEVDLACQRADEEGYLPSPGFFRAPFYWAAGDWAAARELARAALATAQAGSILRQTHELLGTLARDQGEPDQAWEHVRAILPAGPATPVGSYPIRFALSMQQLAAALALDAGDLPHAREWLDAADRWLAWSGSVRWQAEQRLLWARYHQVDGQPERAYAHAAAAIARAITPRQPLALLAAHRFLGELATDLGRRADAATHLAAALPLADACALPHERALTLLALAELRAAEGRPDDAGPPLAQARALLVPLAAAPAIVRADGLVARLATPGAPASHPFGLSARELEVLRLVVAGRTNQEIADALFLSKRTVQVHVAHVLSKTNTPNRVAAATFALQHDLA